MKRSFSLIEILVSLTLFTLLVGTLFFWHQRLSSSKHKLRDEQWPKLEERYCHQRLTRFFGSCDGPFFTSQTRLANLSEGSLVFTFDRGIADDPLLSGQVLARLYHDPQAHALFLGVWPIEQKEPSETYLMLTDVDEMKTEFYQPPTYDLLNDLPSKGWHNSWDSSSLPALMKIYVERYGKQITFAFDLDKPIVYSGSAL